MDAKAENRQRMKNLGLEVNEHGNFEMTPEALAKTEGVEVPASTPAPAPPVPTPTPALAPPPPDPSAPPPTPPAPEVRSLDDQRQVRRLEGVKEEQRKLSALQTELRGFLEEARPILASLKGGAPAAAPAAPAAASVAEERMEALRKASPDLYEAVLALTQSQLRGVLAEATQPVQALKQTLDQLQSEQAENDYDKRFNHVLTAVKAIHPDVETVASDATFQAWLAKQPPMLRDLGVRAIYEDSANADPATIAHFLTAFKKETAPPPVPPQPKPRVAPSLGPSMAAAGAPDLASLLPLSPDEQGNFAYMKAQVAHDPRALAQLMRRVALTLAPPQ